jgi:hypothetical protein
VFGENLSRIAGAMWDEIDTVGMAAIDDNADNALVPFGEEDAAKWAEMRQPIIESVVAEVSEKGVDGAAVREFMMQEMANY